ncbi:esterase [Pontibacter diazotrophicus]|uniref:Esterase n=1 Tax=Pontibacter diazotrophicus TaxID=1400979 RepID=A0A3D8LGP2_9BACT|nr:esterase [Pontibacter diazotrophicus]RDV16601.1 esterase [Pontibacter diazotrophicus]
MKYTPVKESVITSDNLVLHYLVREPKIKSSKTKAIVLLHGVGSDEQDLFSLADHLPADFIVISARGPFSVGPERFAWYNVDFSTGKPLINAAQELSSREVIREFLAQIKQKYSLQEVYLGGFSQGAIMSYSIGLTHPKEVDGVIAFSGRVLENIQSIVTKNEELHRLKVFVAHGVQDGTLPVHYARQAKAFLQNLGVALTYHEYNMGHQINSGVLMDLEAWLKGE